MKLGMGGVVRGREKLSLKGAKDVVLGELSRISTLFGNCDGVT